MPVISRAIVLGSLFLAPLFSTGSAQIVDQSNPATTFTVTFIDWWSGQTFSPTANTVVGAGVNLYADLGQPASGFLFVQLWSDIPSNPGAMQLAGGATTFNLIVGQASFFDVFWTPVTVTPLAQYFLAFSASYDPQFSVATTVTLENNYPSGEAWENRTFEPTNAWNSLGSTEDFSFREYAATPESVVPEPGSIVLLGTGLAGVLLVARLRRKSP